MNIMQHFNRTNTPNYIIYRLKGGEWAAFVNKLTKDVRLCYIDNSDLHKHSTARKISPSEYLEKYILPDEPSIVSGDFGEILSFFAVIENYANKGFTLIYPRKWRWKENRNKPAPGTDAVMFHITNPRKHSSEDFVVSVESKMKAVNSAEHRIQTAIDHAAKDKLSRLAKTLIWLEEKHARHGSEEQRKIVERFTDPATYGTFKKFHKAIAILDSTLETSEISKAFTNPEGVTVIVFSVEDLKKAYEDTRNNVLKSI